MNGLTQGSLYALVAIGFVIVFGTMNLVTFAHGEVYMIGGFAGYFAMSVWPPSLAGRARPGDGRRPG